MGEVVWGGAAKPIERSEIERAEAFLGVKFPDTFVECVLQHDGGTPTPGWVLTASGEHELFDHLISFRANERENIIRGAAGLFEFLPVHVLPFADDGNGNAFVFDFRKTPQEPSIAFVWHEGFHTPEETRLTPVAASFAELLAKLEPDPFLDEDEE